MLDYVVLYESRTGNTKRLAARIFSAIPGNSKDLIDLETCTELPEANIYFIGFAIHMGTCDMEVIDYLDDIYGKKIALFATCGMGCDAQYYKDIENRVRVWVTADNEYLGMYTCQGKMPLKIRKKYESLLGQGEDEQVQKMLRNFDEAMVHPNEEDFKRADEFVKQVLSIED